jgi:hypothetical protein
LLRLLQSVQEPGYIRYLCIWPNNNRIADVHINKILPNGTFIRQTNELQQAMVRILPDYDCMEYRRGDLIIFPWKFMICAG